jgi:hypothetical protein
LPSSIPLAYTTRRRKSSFRRLEKARTRRTTRHTKPRMSPRMPMLTATLCPRREQHRSQLRPWCQALQIQQKEGPATDFAARTHRSTHHATANCMEDISMHSKANQPLAVFTRSVFFTSPPALYHAPPPHCYLFTTRPGLYQTRTHHRNCPSYQDPGERAYSLVGSELQAPSPTAHHPSPLPLPFSF